MFQVRECKLSTPTDFPAQAYTPTFLQSRGHGIEEYCETKWPHACFSRTNLPRITAVVLLSLAVQLSVGIEYLGPTVISPYLLILPLEVPSQVPTYSNDTKAHYRARGHGQNIPWCRRVWPQVLTIAVSNRNAGLKNRGEACQQKRRRDNIPASRSD